MSAPVCVYVDNSNIFIEGQRYARDVRREDPTAFRIYFKNFVELLMRGRSANELVWAGSIPRPNDGLWRHLEVLGIAPELIPRATTGEHETVDNKIQLRMYRHVRKYREGPGTIVLCTGDGKGYDQEEGFLYDLEGHLRDGWKLELFSWSHCCHRGLRELADREGTFFPLEKYYAAITFAEGGRRAMGER